jgi:phosphoenolpyruvate carboxylase
MENVRKLSKDFPALKEVLNDIEFVQEILSLDLKPQSVTEMLHRNLTSNILLKKEAGLDFKQEIVEAAKLRKSLG